MSTTASIVDEVDGLTIATLLRRNASEYGDLPALSAADDDTVPTLTWSGYRAAVAAVSRGLADLGLRAGQRMIIMAPSRPDHLVVDLAAVHLAAIPCTAYATLASEQIKYVVNHSAASVAVLGGAEELARWRPVLSELPNLEHIVFLNADEMPEDDDRFVSLDDVRRRGAELHAADPGVFERRADEIRPDDPLAMIYTSGTTGDPKAVVLSHRNAVHEATSTFVLHGRHMHMANIAYLPLAHIAERVLSIYMPMVYAGHVHTLADPTGIAAALGKVHPEGFFGVPRVWEKIVSGLRRMLASLPDERRLPLEEASDLLQEGFRLRAAGKEVPAELAEQIAKADEAVLAPVRALLGLDKVIWPGTGAAPIPMDVLSFIAGLGVDIQEVWGLSETTGAATINTVEASKPGTVGRAICDVEVRLADDGELLVRGPIVFLGYLQADGSIEPATDADGWFATGDIGTIDDDGFVTITDRKKELIITAGGKNIAPSRIEGLLKDHPLIGQAIAIGDNRPYLSALIVLDDEIAPSWAAAHGIEATDLAALAEHPEVLAEIEKAVAAANEHLARVEQVKRYHVLTRPWGPETGELTPTLKLKRRVITSRYADNIEGLYATS